MYPTPDPTPDPEHLAGAPEMGASLPRSARHPRRGMSPGRKRIVTVLAVLAFLAVPAIAGYQVGKDDGSSTATAVPPFGTDGTSGTSQLPSDGSASLPGTGSSGSTSTGSTSPTPPRSPPRSTTWW